MIIADSGSTKTIWAIISSTGSARIIQTQGLNPYFTTSELMATILDEELRPQVEAVGYSQVWFYGAGCSTQANNRIVTEHLTRIFPKAEIWIHHDILGAARALFGKSEGIACILGTGCNSCFYDGKEVFSPIPSLGYLFGDEGAGADLGKKLLGRYLKQQLPIHLSEAFEKRYNLTLESILNSLYNKPFPNRYLASFALFLKDHDTDPYVRNLVYSSFIEFIEAHVIRYPDYKKYPTAFIGSIAWFFQDILLEAAGFHSIMVSAIRQAPIESLIDFHLKNGK